MSVDETLPSATSTISLVGVAKANDPDLVDTTGTAIGRAVSGAAVLTPNASFGADGAAATNSLSYALSILDADGIANLTTTEGNAINLVLQQNNTVLVGVVSGGTFAGQAAFAIAIGATLGDRHVEQYLSLDHPGETDPDDALSFLAGRSAPRLRSRMAITTSATPTAVDISSLFTFRDDGPSAAPTLNAAATMSVDETLPSATSTISLVGVAKANDPDLVDTTGTAIGRAVSGAAVLTPNASFGADGAAATNSLSYALSILDADGIANLTTTEGNAINLVLQQNNTVLVGVVSGGTFAGQAAFAIAIGATSGIVTVEQYLSLDHPGETDPDDALSFLAGSVGATVTVKDGDNDVATPTAVDISSLFTFRDDGPNCQRHGPVGDGRRGRRDLAGRRRPSRRSGRRHDGNQVRDGQCLRDLRHRRGRSRRLSDLERSRQDRLASVDAEIAGRDGGL